MRTATKGKSIGKLPAKSTFMMGGAGEKTPIKGNVIKGKDLRSNPGKNQGKMPKSM